MAKKLLLYATIEWKVFSWKNIGSFADRNKGGVGGGHGPQLQTKYEIIL
jgi:hypothetical protein